MVIRMGSDDHVNYKLVSVQLSSLLVVILSSMSLMREMDVNDVMTAISQFIHLVLDNPLCVHPSEKEPLSKFKF